MQCTINQNTTIKISASSQTYDKKYQENNKKINEHTNGYYQNNRLFHQPILGIFVVNGKSKTPYTGLVKSKPSEIN